MSSQSADRRASLVKRWTNKLRSLGKHRENHLPLSSLGTLNHIISDSTDASPSHTVQQRRSSLEAEIILKSPAQRVDIRNIDNVAVIQSSPNTTHLALVFSDKDDLSSTPNAYLNTSFHSYEYESKMIQTRDIPTHVEIVSDDEDSHRMKKSSSSLTFSQAIDEDYTNNGSHIPNVIGTLLGETVDFNSLSTASSFGSIEEKPSMLERTSLEPNTNTRIENTPITCGMYVDIIGGTYKGKTQALVIKVMNKMVRLKVPGDQTEHNIHKINIQPSQTRNDVTHTSPIKTKQVKRTKSPTQSSGIAIRKPITTPTQVEHTNFSKSINTPNTVVESLSVGAMVDVIAGLYKGTKGAVIVKVTDKMVRLRFPGSNDEKMVKKASIQLCHRQNQNRHQLLDLKWTDHSNSDQDYGGRGGGGVLNVALGYNNVIQSTDEYKTPQKTTTIDRNPSSLSSPNDFKLVDGGKSPLKMGNFYMIRMIASSIKPDSNCFLEYQWGNRLIIKDIRLKENVSIEPIMKQNGFTLQLVSAKVHSESTGFAFQNQEYLRVAYAIESGPNIQTRSVKEELLKIADFASLSTSKVVSRLELLQSPAHKIKGKSAIHILDSSLFCNIDEAGHIGCGFISGKMLEMICGSTPSTKRISCIQVRLIIPKMGLFKGVLMRKKIDSGPPIQLPESMRKVGPSLDSCYAHLAFLLICQAGLDPSSNNLFVGRLPSINPSAKPPPPSFRPKPLSDMIIRLFKGLQVPSTVIDNYVNQSSRVIGLNHAFVRGVADPTGKIPAGSVYLSGMACKDLLGDSIFITRSPCIKCSDARKISIVKERPHNMSLNDWSFLEGLHFGTVIFGFPEKGHKALPEMIASGDLDGDRYFVCWSDVILKHVVIDALENSATVDEESKKVAQNPAWFEDAQRVMIDTGSRNAGNQLIGKLYMLSLKAADESDQFMRDPKSQAFADAYYNALDSFKHGNKILLPLELHEFVPEKLRMFLDTAPPL